MDEAGIEARGLAPLKPYLARIDAVKTRPQLVKLMAEPAYAAPIYLGISATRTIRRVTPPPLAKHGSVSPRVIITCSRATNTIQSARPIASISSTSPSSPDFPIPKGERTGSSRSKPASPKDQWTPERRRDPVDTLQPDDARAADEARAAVQLAGNAKFDRPRLARRRSTWRSRARSPPPASAIADVPLSTWKEYLDLPLHQRPRERSAQGVRRCAVRFLRPHAERRSRAADALEARHVDARRQPRRGGRAALRRQILAGPNRDARRRSWSTTCAPLIARRSTSAAGWTRRPARRRSRSSPRSIRASAIR